ncbi:MAG: F0F1 ATP synthase subunit A [Bacteroidales bacterium]|nr:F0F1 ATP synthase subunit A [Bacteroidales bacterium]
MAECRIIYLVLVMLITSLPGYGQHGTSEPENHGTAEEEFAATEFILEHIADSHEWHILTTPGGHHVSVYLPVILYSKYTGFHLFSSKRLAHGHHHEGFFVQEEGPQEGRIAEEEYPVDGEIYYLPLDFSVTKNVAAMIVVAIIVIMLFTSLARSYRRTGVSEPRGLQGFLEPLILFVKEDIAIPNIGDKHEKFLPYLLTVFFFILFNNVFGLVPFFPFGANVTGNIAVTLVLASFTFLVTQFSGNKAYWRHVFATPGVPFWLLPVMMVVELIGIIAKPFALMVRLFANITAGHIIVIALVSVIFIFKTLWVLPGAVVFVLFMDCLELLVAFLQAYVFTLLSALFIGIAVEEHH